MRTFYVPVRNESTGETRILHVSSGYAADAQLLALHELFELEGWRKATACKPEENQLEAEE
jgi:hypothetical protein